jgi:hypothetical protein
MSTTMKCHVLTLPLGVSSIPSGTPLAESCHGVVANISRHSLTGYSMTLHRHNEDGVESSDTVSGLIGDVIRLSDGNYIIFEQEGVFELLAVTVSVQVRVCEPLFSRRVDDVVPARNENPLQLRLL